jgi:3-methylcrotonyl-CoA carboxylase alpha subunit
MPDSFDSVLIANRGEIAVRIIRACRETGLRSVAIYSDADAGALHVRQADEAHRVGPSPAGDSYLNRAAIIEIAQRSGADALHPGYGFLAEDAAFAELCQRAGLVWIGPPPAAMRLLGDKAAARDLAERLGVPILAGYHGQTQAEPALLSAAEKIGYPLLIKAASGGGGRGMRLVRASRELGEALSGARREAESAFGDGRLLLERYLERARHVEMQVFGDAHGVIYLGERDCSIQRRHQKIIEEAPAPQFSQAQRVAMGEAAVALAREAGYSSAGTVEFLLEEDGRFYFLEVNTRLQVEHPVTEMVTGLDLVKLQLRVAAGEPLTLRQDQVEVKGHAIEARLYAEDPSAGFLPSSGTLEYLQLPAGRQEEDSCVERLRVDTGIEQGDVVSSFYDPLLAKIIAKGSDRQTAVDLMADALASVWVLGVRTNVEFLQAIVASPSFGDGLLHTSFLEEHGLERGPLRPPDELLVAAAASEVFEGREPSLAPGDPWRQAGPWRTGWVGAEVKYRSAGRLFSVRLSPPLAPDEPWRFQPSDDAPEYLATAEGPEIVVDGPSGRSRIQVLRSDHVRIVKLGRQRARVELVSNLDSEAGERRADVLGQHDVVCAPMPGRIVKVAVRAGDAVMANQTLLVLEAMKIEHLVGAPRDGIVEKVRYKEGDQVEQGAELVDLEDL